MCILKPKTVALPPPKNLVDIDYSEILTIINSECKGAAVFISDRNYKTTDVGELKRFLKDDKTDEFTYIAEYMDCDNFSFHLMGSIHCIEWGAIPFGIVWAQTPKGEHAVNCFIDNERKFWIVEPQNDSVYELPSNWVICFIVI